jgi:hypothetical protein
MITKLGLVLKGIIFLSLKLLKCNQIFFMEALEKVRPRTGLKSRKRISKKLPVNKSAKKDIAASFNKFKMHDGKQYTGMAVGRSHKWYYDKGEWKETKITPDLWRISYGVTKRRTGKAPEGSGATVGTAYHWYILAHQEVLKLNANDYSTYLTGLKYKLAHKRAGNDKWNVKTPTQRKHLVSFLREWIQQLEEETIPLELEYKGNSFKGEGVPIPATCENDFCSQLEIMLNDENMGIIRKGKTGWKMDKIKDQKFINAIGETITLYYSK